MDQRSHPYMQAQRRGIMSYLFALENSRAAYVADLVLYGVAVFALAGFLFSAGSQHQRLEWIGLTIAGVGAWSFIEYLLHRFLLHGVKPFSDWHAEHHRRPKALIYTPTIVTALIQAMLVFLPAYLAFGNVRDAIAFTLGMIAGFLAFGIVHHAVHHWRLDHAWLKPLKRWHAMHHHTKQGCYYGVTSVFWDHVFGSIERPGG